MGTSNPNWDRWVKASVLADIDAWNLALPVPYAKFVEGDERKTNLVPAWIEVRLEGPSKFQYSKDFWRLNLEINILCSCGIDNDAYHIDRMKGDISSWFKPAICVFQLGAGPGDDPSAFLGTLQQTTIGKDNLLVRDYGQVGVKEKLVQAIVAANYFIDIP